MHKPTDENPNIMITWSGMILYGAQPGGEWCIGKHFFGISVVCRDDRHSADTVDRGENALQGAFWAMAFGAYCLVRRKARHET